MLPGLHWERLSFLGEFWAFGEGLRRWGYLQDLRRIGVLERILATERVWVVGRVWVLGRVSDLRGRYW